MMQTNLRQELESKLVSELRQLSEQVFGKKNTSMKKGELVDLLLTRSEEVVALLQPAQSFRQRHSKEIFAGLLATVLAVTGIVFTVIYSPDETSSEVDRREVLRMVRNVHKNIIPPTMKAGITVAKAIEKDFNEECRVEVENLPRIDNFDFQLLEEEIIWDLTGFVKVSSQEYQSQKVPKLLSRATQTVRLRLRKTKPQSTFQILAHTTGADIFARPGPTYNGKVTLIANIDPEEVVGAPIAQEEPMINGYKVKRRIINIDVSAAPVDVEFPVELTKEFWNSMQNEDQSWVGMVVPPGRDQPMDKISFLVVFPEEMPFSEYALFVTDENTGKRVSTSAEEILVEDPDKLYIYWQIEDPVPNHSYNIDWEW